MTKEQLMALGLTEEQADAVINGYGQMVPKSRLDTKIQEVTDLKGQLADRDTQLEELKKVDAEGLQTKITELQQANENIKTEYEQKLQQRDYDYALENALRDAKAKNPVAVKALLKTDTIQLVNGQFVGLEEQLTALKTSDDYLFAVEGVKGKTPPNPEGGGKPAVTKEQFAKMSIVEKTELYNTNYDLYKTLVE